MRVVPSFLSHPIWQATRIWLDTYVPTDTPANVFSRFPALRGAGGTFFMLDQLQPDQQALWGGEEPQVRAELT